MWESEFNFRIDTDTVSKKILFQKEQKHPPEVFCKIGALRNFAKFTGKQLCQRLFFNKVADLYYATPPGDCFCEKNVTI